MGNAEYMGIAVSRNNNTKHQPDISPVKQLLIMETRILKRITMLFLLFLIKLTSSRPQTNPQTQEANSPECGSSYCEEVPNYPDEIIIKLLNEANILPGTFDGDRQRKSSFSGKNDQSEYDLINFIKI